MSDLLKTLFVVEGELNETGNIMSQLGPKLTLIGSIPEGRTLFNFISVVRVMYSMLIGTRLGHPDELDMTTTFDLLDPSFFEANIDNAMGLNLSSVGVDFFTKLQKERELRELNLPQLVLKGNLLNMVAFQGMFLNGLEQAIAHVKLPKNVQLGTLNSDFDISSCDDCVKASREEGNWKHCASCFPLLAQTKKGVVLNLIWSNGDTQFKCSIDLVPLFQVPEKDLSKLFGCLVKTLIEEKPPGWKLALQKNIDVNRPTVSGFMELAKLDLKKQDFLLIGMKALHYGPGNNYMIAPGQTTGTKQYASRRIREAYTFTKGLIKLLDLPIKSYFLKKIFLAKSMVEFSQTTRSNQHFILSILSRPEFGTLFTDHLDMEKMEEYARRVLSQDFRVFVK